MRRILWTFVALLLTTTGALAQQQYDPGGKAKVSLYCTTTTVGDTACPPSTGGGSISPAPYQETFLSPQTALTVASSTALTPPATATIAVIVVESNTTYNQKIRCLADGTAPTTTTGLELSPGASWRVVSTNAGLANVKCIQEAASAAIDVVYSK